ncbi:uncharacterized protein PG986_010234 [Apiospora aurea]|uniref:Uncharacterized protein n=1 Tax=Apiospora aurea TaxID=335848 RepID=A0ABR1QAA6_9PEZI
METATAIWRAAAGHHKKTLRRFVFHQRRLTGVDYVPPSCGEEWDQLDLSLESSGFESSPDENSLGYSDLKSLVLGCSPEWMTRIVSPFCQKTSLQILHMRRSGPEFARIARLQGKAPRVKPRVRNPLISDFEYDYEQPDDDESDDDESDDDESDECSDSEGHTGHSIGASDVGRSANGVAARGVRAARRRIPVGCVTSQSSWDAGPGHC